MNSQIRQYLFGAIFFAVGMYQLYVKDYLEFSLYAAGGSAFIVNALTFEPKLSGYKKSLVRVSWILIGTTGILLLYMLQFKYF
jgi:hypothetical protein